MRAYCDRSFLESKLSCLDKKTYNPYQWWRRYGAKKELNKKTPLYEKIKNGDYDPSSYLYQMEHEFYLMDDKLSSLKDPEKLHEARSLFLERARRLNEDYQKNEKEIMDGLCTDFCKTFKMSRQELTDIMESFDGTLLELYEFVKKSKNGDVD